MVHPAATDGWRFVRRGPRCRRGYSVRGSAESLQWFLGPARAWASPTRFFCLAAGPCPPGIPPLAVGPLPHGGELVIPRHGLEAMAGGSLRA